MATKRRGRSPTLHIGTNTTYNNNNHDDDDDGNHDNHDATTPLDRDDQDAIVESLELEIFDQSKQFHTYYSFVCAFAMMVSICYPLLCQEECAKTGWTPCWCHAVVSSGTHGLSMALSWEQQKAIPRCDAVIRAPVPSILSKMLFTANAGLIVMAIILWLAGMFPNDIEHLHIGLTVGNMVTFMGYVLLRWDVESTIQALNSLHGAKYEHKSL